MLMGLRDRVIALSEAIAHSMGGVVWQAAKLGWYATVRWAAHAFALYGIINQPLYEVRRSLQ